MKAIEATDVTEATEALESAAAETPGQGSRRSRQGKSIWHYLGLSASAALLMLVIALAALVIVLPKVAGGMPLTVLTSSMSPSLPAGTLIVVRPVDPNDLRIGDVVTYQIESGKPGVITHRIVSITSSTNGDRSFTLKGDNNSTADDDLVEPGQIQGVLWYSLPALGYVNNAVNGKATPWLLPAGATLLFAYAGVMIVDGVRASVSKRRSS